MMGLLGLFVIVVWDLFALLGARILIARAFGIKTLRFFPTSDPPDAFDRPPRFARPTIAIGGAAVTYAVSALFFTASLAVGGEPVSTTCVNVVDGPAKTAGVRDGDCIVAVGDRTIATFDDVVAAVQDSQGRAVVLHIARSGSPLELTASPMTGGTDRWRIGVFPIYERRAPGVGQAIAYGLSSPAGVLLNFAKAVYEIFAKPPATERASAVSMVREMQHAARTGPAEVLGFAGVCSSYLWPVLILAGALMVRKAKPRRSPP